MLSVQGLILIAMLFGMVGFATGEWFGSRKTHKHWEKVLEAYEDAIAKKIKANTNKFKEVVADYKVLADKFLELKHQNDK